MSLALSLNPKLHDWRGRTVLAGGASTGIGRHGRAAAQAGAAVIVSARQRALLEAFVREHPGSEGPRADVLDASALR